MPNYEERRYRAEEMRRDADNLRQRYGTTPKSLPHINMLIQGANMLDEQNERENPSRYRDESEMRQGGEKRGRYNPQDYPRSEYFPPEMARRQRDSRGRYMEMDSPISDIYPSYPNNRPPYMTMNMDMDSKYPQKRQIGFAQSKGGGGSDMFEEMEEYYNDYIKHKHMYEQTKSLEEKEHMKLELEELTEYITEFLKTIQKKATTQEEMQLVQKMMQKISKNSTGAQTF